MQNCILKSSQSIACYSHEAEVYLFRAKWSKTKIEINTPIHKDGGDLLFFYISLN